VFNALGQSVQQLANSQQSPGEYQVNFDASKLGSGVYYYRLTAGNFSQTRKMLLMR